jgi:hypothetical protein
MALITVFQFRAKPASWDDAVVARHRVWIRKKSASSRAGIGLVRIPRRCVHAKRGPRHETGAPRQSFAEADLHGIGDTTSQFHLHAFREIVEAVAFFCHVANARPCKVIGKQARSVFGQHRQYLHARLRGLFGIGIVHEFR